MSGVGIPYDRLRSLSARELIRALLHDGFVLLRQEGSHQRYAHRDGRRVTVTFHSLGQTFPLKTLKSMLEKQAGWTAKDLESLGIL